MKLLITGAAGFIGSQVSKRYLLEGHEVVGVDSLSSYYSVKLKEERLELLHQLGAGFNFRNIDLCDSAKVNEIFTKAHYDCVIHLAAQPGIRLPMDEYHRYVSSNLVAFSNVLIASTINRVQSFLYASSSSVYGNTPNVPYKEGDSEVNPISFYGATKLSNEILAKATTRNSGTRARGLRFFTVYGPLGRPDMAYLRILNAIVNDSEFQLFGNGDLQRDFTYIDDVVNSIYLLQKQLTQMQPGHADIVNVGGGNPYSMNELIEVFEKLTRKNLKYNRLAKHEGDVSLTIADTALQRDLTGFTPSTSLEEGASRILEWLNQDENHLKLNNWISG